MLNLSVCLESSARDFPEKAAIQHQGQTYTFRQINEMSCQVAGLLRENGISGGDRVALTCPNTPMFAVCYYGILKTGATVVPLNILLKSREIQYHLEELVSTINIS